MNQLETDFINYVLEIAKENPDYQYCPMPGSGCHYTRGYGDVETESPNPNCTGCLLGRAMARLGADKEFLSRVTFSFGNEYASALQDHLTSKGLYSHQVMSTTVISLLQDVQEQQDSGRLWGHCVRDLSSLVSQ